MYGKAFFIYVFRVSRSLFTVHFLLFTFYFLLLSLYFYLLSFGKYAILAGILDMAFDGQVRAIEQSLQFTHLS
jgi:hypothetical protein